jgi:hypothetical protein
MGKEGVREGMKINSLKEELPVLGVNENTVEQARHVGS